MTKSDRPRISIKTKIWMAIMGTVIAIIASIWLSQVYLESYYLASKESSFSKVSDRIVNAIDTYGIVNYQKSWYPVPEIAFDEHLNIDITDLRDNTSIVYNNLGTYSYIHESKSNKQEVISRLETAGNYRVTEAVTNGTNSYFIVAQQSETVYGEPYIVIITTDLAPLKEAAAAIRDHLLLIFLGLILLGTGIAFIVSHSLSRNILKINAAARQVAKGNLNAHAAVTSNDELGDLSESFNHMVREISKVNVLQKELVANISHDIRTPLTMIRGYAEAIRDITGEDRDVREQQLDIIIDETGRLATLVNDVMDLSLLQAGQTPLNISVFDIRTKAADILSRFALLEQTSGFSLQLEAQGEMWVSADEVRIEQVLYNLIGNAANHAGESKVITVRIALEENSYRVSVIDTGAGIAKADLPLIWNRYYKPYKKAGRKGVGTGLGLSIVKAILKAHRSRFGVSSKLGAGSCFWFTLPEAEKASGQQPQKINSHK